jgi:hypothetical protein
MHDETACGIRAYNLRVGAKRGHVSMENGPACPLTGVLVGKGTRLATPEVIRHRMLLEGPWGPEPRHWPLGFNRDGVYPLRDLPGNSYFGRAGANQAPLEHVIYTI